jgi:hypothetical protein
MGTYDDILEKGNSRPNREFETDRLDSQTESSFEPVDFNIMDIINDADGPFADIVGNLNPDMKSKVLLPLANLLDKYGFSDSIGQSPTANNAIGLVSVLTDVAPVIKGLADFVSGQKNALAAEDKAFLQEIMEAQESADFSDLFGDEASESETIESVEDNSNKHEIIGDVPQLHFDSVGGVDWMKVMDPDGTYLESFEKKNSGMEAYEELYGSMGSSFNSNDKAPALVNPGKPVKMQTLEELMAEAGLTAEETNAADTNIKPEKENDYSLPPTSQDIVDITEDSFDMDSIMDMDSVDEIYYLDDDELEEMQDSGFELEEIEILSEEEFNDES